MLIYENFVIYFPKYNIKIVSCVNGNRKRVPWRIQGAQNDKISLILPEKCIYRCHKTVLSRGKIIGIL